jgi:UDP-N-acetylglucosamine 4,6-dehydratase
MLDNKTILITGGTGSFGQNATEFLLSNSKAKKIIIFSRDENKQFIMQNKFKDKRLRFFLGDVRDQSRIELALNDVDLLIHAAALKHVPAAEYNPFEFIKTNIYGAENVISASLSKKVKKVLMLSTDKACNPINLYGATKLCAEKLFVNANYYSGTKGTLFGVVRYGNVISSRGSVIPLFKNLIKNGQKEVPLTHKDMTRFFITLPEAIKFVFNCLNFLKGGEIFIPKMKSIHISDIIKLIDSKIKIKISGIRAGEKIHETLCSHDESNYVYENKSYYAIYPPIFFLSKFKTGKKVKQGFVYSSNIKSNFFKTSKFKEIIKKY